EARCGFLSTAPGYFPQNDSGPRDRRPLASFRVLATNRAFSVRLILLILIATVTPALAAGLPKQDLDFLRDLARDVIAASSVPPGSNGGSTWELTNACGFTLIT